MGYQYDYGRLDETVLILHAVLYFPIVLRDSSSNLSRCSTRLA
jgi:hypothetical protein